MSSSVDIDESLSLSSLSLGTKEPENFLPLKGPQRFGTLGFKNYNLIGSFEITKEQKYSDNSESSPKILSLISSSEIQTLKGTFLGAGYETAVGMKDYQAYHQLKQDYFFKWLSEHEYFHKVEENLYKKPDFICFGGRITDPMQSPLKSRFGEWMIYASRFMDTIFIWDEKDIKKNNARTKESFYGIGFESLLTGKKPSEEVINEFEKTFVIQEANFGVHQLLLVSEIDALDEEGKWTEIKVYKQCSPKGMQAKYLGYWAQSVVAGVDNLVLGRRDDQGCLQETSVLQMDEILRRAGCGVLGVNRCYDFEDRLLNWIKSHFKENDPKIVKNFVWTGPPSEKVTCSIVPDTNLPKGMIPEWFVRKQAQN